VVTRIEHDGAMYRRMVDTAWQSDPRKWEDLAARALAVRPPYRPVPGTAVYHICADGYIVQVGEYDLEGPLRDLVIVVLAAGSQMLAPPPFGTDRPRAHSQACLAVSGRRNGGTTRQTQTPLVT